MPVEPPPSIWRLPDPEDESTSLGDLVGVGGDMEPGTLLAAYRRGLFPMPLPDDLRNESGGVAPIGWWSPDPRGVLPLGGFRTSRSLRRSARKFEVRVDTAFQRVVEECGNPSRPDGWIDDDIVAAYLGLFELGWAHSVESWDVDDGTLAGGLYGVGCGAFFAGESMFHRQTDASKVALMGLVHLLGQRNYQLLDVQWRTDHLATLGVVEMPRYEYLAALNSAVAAIAEPLGPLEKPLRFQPFAH